MNCWNANRGEMLMCSTLDVKNRRALAQRRVDEVPSLSRWATAITRAAKSPILTGQLIDEKPPFSADFDWLLKPESLVMIEEGKFDDRRPREITPPDTPSPKDISYWDTPKLDFRMTPTQILRCQIEGRLQRKIERETKKTIEQLAKEGLYSWP